ncbi:hypothetical protein [Arcobacter sp. LA11]|uniref:hypothetical protein n=1 Tax=Arcobacter sp. LA11 TaxID=1898176 RepID=UPI0015756C49|nr:hypothetical protein [Arcobacter sp. LA11]
MSDITIKKEIRGVIRNSGFRANPKMVCSIVKIMNMKYSHIDNKKVASIANEIINEQVV